MMVLSTVVSQTLVRALLCTYLLTLIEFSLLPHDSCGIRCPHVDSMRDVSSLEETISLWGVELEDSLT